MTDLGRTVRAELSGNLDMTSARVAVEIAHLALRGTASDTAAPVAAGGAAESSIDSAAAGAVDSLVLDVTRVGFVDSSGLGGLVQVSNYAESRGVRVYLDGASPRLRSLLELTGLSSLLPCLEPADADCTAGN
ncbi:MAG TPA: STAS domain-containing protein [Jatrophihabitans sp.]|nr:STAS domain-containing protein [Jatrophihabitans sp.]